MENRNGPHPPEDEGLVSTYPRPQHFGKHCNERGISRDHISTNRAKHHSVPASLLRLPNGAHRTVTRAPVHSHEAYQHYHPTHDSIQHAAPNPLTMRLSTRAKNKKQISRWRSGQRWLPYNLGFHILASLLRASSTVAFFCCCYARRQEQQTLQGIPGGPEKKAYCI